MFWKRKNKKDKPFTAPSDTRKAFRVSPDPLFPIKGKIGEKSFKVLEISSKGLSFASIGHEPGDVCYVKLCIPDISFELEAGIMILTVDKDGICHCQFETLTSKDEDAIHRYVLNRQKEELRSRKKSE